MFSAGNLLGSLSSHGMRLLCLQFCVLPLSLHFLAAFSAAEARERPSHLLVEREHIHGGFGLLALARGRQKLVADVQEEAVARVEPRAAAAAMAHNEALHRPRRRARLH